MPRPKIKDANKVKSERISLMVKPKTKERISKIAFMKKTSLNDLLQSVLDNYTEKHRKEIEAYDRAFSDDGGETA